jgi:hypothetical protein
MLPPVLPLAAVVPGPSIDSGAVELTLAAAAAVVALCSGIAWAEAESPVPDFLGHFRRRPNALGGLFTSIAALPREFSSQIAARSVVICRTATPGQNATRIIAA